MYFPLQVQSLDDEILSDPILPRKPEFTVAAKSEDATVAAIPGLQPPKGVGATVITQQRPIQAQSELRPPRSRSYRRAQQKRMTAKFMWR